MAEAHAPSNIVGAIVYMKGQLNIRLWEETASAAMGHVWFADSEKVFLLSWSLPIPDRLTIDVWGLPFQL